MVLHEHWGHVWKDTQICFLGFYYELLKTLNLNEMVWENKDENAEGKDNLKLNIFY